MARKRQPTIDLRGYHRANRAGMMLLVMTLCQLLVPTVFSAVLELFGADLSSPSWGMPSAGYLLLYLLLYVLTMGIPLLLNRRLLMPKMRRLSPLNLLLDRRLCVVLCGVALCLIANMVAALLNGALFHASSPVSSATVLGDGSVPTLLLDLLVFALAPAVLEETLLRGMVLQTLRPLGDKLAVVVSAVLFALMHGNLRQALYTLMMGLVLGFVFVYTDNLRLTVAVHALANGLSVFATFLLQFTDTDFATFWELVILVVALMLGGVSTLWLWRHPLERSRPPLPTSAVARFRAMIKAPLLWAAVTVMVIRIIALL